MATTKLKIRLKGSSSKAVAAAPAGASNHHAAQLQDLRAAVEAFCRQGIASLPGGVLLPPWREPAVEQPCWADTAEPMDVDQQQQQAAGRRMRRPRAMPAADLLVLGPQRHLPQWGRHRQQRSSVPQRRRAAAHLTDLVHAMLPPAEQPAQRAPPQPAAQAGQSAGRQAKQPQQQQSAGQQELPQQGGRAPRPRRSASAAQLQEQPPQPQPKAATAGPAAARKQAGQKQKLPPSAAAQQERPAKQRRTNSRVSPSAAGAEQAAAGAAAAVKPESPPSETSHQQPISAVMPQLMQQRLQAPQLPRDQTAWSRDRSQHSQQPAAGASGSGAASRAHAAAGGGGGPPSAGGGGAAGGAPGTGRPHLLELAPAAMTPAARALGGMVVPPVSFRRVLPADRPIRTQEEALALLDSLVAAAREKKHQGDRRMKKQGCWDVMALNYYALSALEFLLLNDAGARLLKQLQERRQPAERLADRLAGMNKSSSMFKQVCGLCSSALAFISTCQGPDVAKQALRMLLERLAAICQLKHLQSQHVSLNQQALLLKGAAGGGGAGGHVHAGGSSGSASSGRAASAGSQQQRAAAVAGGGRPPARPAAAPPAAAAAAPAASSSSSPSGQQAFNKRSPDDSNASAQERVHLPLLPGGLHDHAASPGRAPTAATTGGSSRAHAAAQQRALMLAESACAEQLGDLLKITDGMHQTVMRLQQYLELPAVVASDDARAAALHISVLGLDAGMFSVPRVVAHAEAALTCILKYMRSASS